MFYFYNIFWVKSKLLNENLIFLLALWIQSIQNHFWWSLDTATSAKDLVERFQSILHHIVDRHEWSGNHTFKRCEHGPVANRKWMDPGSTCYKELRSMLKSPLMVKDLLQIGKSVHTTRLEVCVMFFIMTHLFNERRPKLRY